jgi:DNA phosphorothioation-associated putative methyltransferase
MELLMVGKKIGSNLYVYKDNVTNLSNEYNNFIEKCMCVIDTKDMEFNVYKINIKDQKLSLLLYKDFFDTPFPKLFSSISINCETKKILTKSFKNSKNIPILHRKELLLSASHPEYEKFKELTSQVESYGLFKETHKIGFSNYWEELLKKKNLSFNSKTYQFEKKQIIQRHKAAITRHELSLPIRKAILHKMITPEHSIFDYGCGKGSDIELLKQANYDISGFDPYYFSSNPKIKADVVNLGYVINVIEDKDERDFVLKDAFHYANKLLIVSVMMIHQKNYDSEEVLNDGCVTKSNTFQRYYSQEEIKDYIDFTLDALSIPVAQGIFFVFKDKQLQEKYLLNKYKNCSINEIIFENRLPRLKRMSVREKHFEIVQDEMMELWKETLQQGRILFEDEIQDEMLLLLKNEYRSINRIYKALFENFEIDVFEKSMRLKMEELLVYFALTQFKEPMKFKEYNLPFQRDIKAHFRSHKNGLIAGKKALHEIADSYLIFEAVNKSCQDGLGFIHDGHSYMFHRKILDKLPPILRIYVYTATFLFGEVDDVDIFKIHLQSDKLTLLYFDDFSKKMPVLKTRVKIDLGLQDLDIFNYSLTADKQLLYLKSYYLDPLDNDFKNQKDYDEELEKLNLFEFTDRPVSQQEFFRKYNEITLRL